MLMRSAKTLLVLGALLAAACGDDGEKTPPTNNDKKDASSFTDEPDAEVVDEDAEVPDGGTATDPNYASKAEADQNGWAEGCFKGKPTKNEEFLNSCAKGYRNFDTKLYPSIWSADKLPALP